MNVIKLKHAVGTTCIHAVKMGGSIISKSSYIYTPISKILCTGYFEVRMYDDNNIISQ